MRIQRFAVLIFLLLAGVLAPLRAAEAPPSASLLFRLDYHYGALNPWLFYERPVAKNIGLSAVFQVSTPQGATPAYAQIDIGPNFHIGNFQLIPEVGLQFVQTAAHGARPGYISPEVFAFYNDPDWNFESQNIYFIKIAEAEEIYSTFYYYLYYLGHRLYKGSFLGPQFEGYLFPDLAPDHYFGAHLDLDLGGGLLQLVYAQNRDERGLFRMTFLRAF